MRLQHEALGSPEEHALPGARAPLLISAFHLSKYALDLLECWIHIVHPTLSRISTAPRRCTYSSDTALASICRCSQDNQLQEAVEVARTNQAAKQHTLAVACQRHAPAVVSPSPPTS